MYAGIFEDSLTPTKKSVSKLPIDNSGKKSFQKRNKIEGENGMQQRGQQDSDPSFFRQEKGKLISEWMGFTTVKGSLRSEKKVCFVINDPNAV
eukprot:CAMPEP_0176426902 /NCGR_PEP_ID=MMETSP0127-20121128/12214_1 /TAXON_ID=938130 /ORGANISM="Platyophrya macrostoma, Strain WH" /LENGTH=92 /DNA_ID=CAMNT_0017808249 /DNA_START=39 /DNA_END=313 /DNA_ORIENTATION=+